MAGSTYGNLFRITTWGESHGPALGVVIDGCPAGLSLCAEDIQVYLDRRKPGTSSVTTQRKEDDKVEILSGVFEGRTTGAPISLMIRNTSQHSKDYSNIANCYRPGHADFSFDAKYGFRDYRGGGRSSGRETAARVAAGAVAIKILKELGISLTAYTKAIGPIEANDSKPDISFALSHPVCMPDREAGEKALAFIDEKRLAKDSVGGCVKCIISGAPAGVGEPVFDKLDAALSKAMFSIGAVKAVEIGDGISASQALGSENNDGFTCADGRIATATNHCGGILGGISTGGEIVIKTYFKPTPSIYQPQKTVDQNGNAITLSIEGRHDPCIVPRAVVVVEAMTALTLLDLLLANAGAKMEHLHKIYS